MSRLSLKQNLDLNFSDQGSGPALLFFNGATLPLEFWDPIAEALDDDFRLIRFDQRNAGETRFDGTFSLNDTAADAAALLDHLGVDSVTLVGHAWGGRAAQVFARDYPHLVRSMIICGTGGQLPAQVDPAQLEAAATAARSGQRQAWEDALAAIYCAAGFRERTPERFAAISELLWGKRPPGRARWDNRISPSDSYWGLSRTPTLLIYGREDQNGTPENAEHLAAALPDARLEFIEAAGHFVIRETPDQVVSLMRPFLARESAQ